MSPPRKPAGWRLLIEPTPKPPEPPPCRYGLQMVVYIPGVGHTPGIRELVDYATLEEAEAEAAHRKGSWAIVQVEGLPVTS